MEVDAHEKTRPMRGVGVGIDESGEDHFLFEVDDRGSWTDESIGAGFCTDISDSIAGDGDSLRPFAIGVDGVDSAVLEYKVSFLRIHGLLPGSANVSMRFIVSNVDFLLLVIENDIGIFLNTNWLADHCHFT
jgi:hypothetical protein